MTRKKRLISKAIDLDNEFTLLRYLLHNFIVFLIVQLIIVIVIVIVMVIVVVIVTASSLGVAWLFSSKFFTSSVDVYQNKPRVFLHFNLTTTCKHIA